MHFLKMHMHAIFFFITLYTYGVGSNEVNTTAEIIDFDLNRYRNIGGKYYWINVSTRLNWHEAWLSCRERDGFLASFKNLHELNLLSGELKRLHIFTWIWTDGTDLANVGDFRWYSNAQAVSSELYEANQPDYPGREQCLSIRIYNNVGYLINNLRCNEKYNYVCQLDL